MWEAGECLIGEDCFVGVPDILCGQVILFYN
jgi:hypothetical protein